MNKDKIRVYLKQVLENMPEAWLKLTTHRLDIYNESLAKTAFLADFESLYQKGDASQQSLMELPTAYDYIRLGHPLSSILEWAIAEKYHKRAEGVISFSSRAMPVYAILRKNLLAAKKTRIYYTASLPSFFNEEILKEVYAYQFELREISATDTIEHREDETSIYLNSTDELCRFEALPAVDFIVNMDARLGSVLMVNNDRYLDYVSEIQHVRRRESIAITPANALIALQNLVADGMAIKAEQEIVKHKAAVLKTIAEITGADTDALLASSGLSMQYAIVMGLIHDALVQYPGKAIKIIVPPNCYGGTNDQARRVAACLANVEVVDLPVDGGQNMVQSVEVVLSALAKEDAVPFIIAEIPTNPRVEVPDLIQLEKALSAERLNPAGQKAIAPVFILDQTFCPNTQFLGENEILSTVRTIAYVSGSKFPSGGLVTAGYAVANHKAARYMEKIALHLSLCDNEATPKQCEVLAQQMPSMNQRILEAYQNTREFVNYIQAVLPDAKINFVSEELAKQGFTPSVFSLDLPTKGDTDEVREAYKRALNLQLIKLMISEIPNESKHCVSYGQLHGVYWTIPATSTQGTTKEGDKDYIARVSLAADMDLEKHKAVFAKFVESIK